MRCPRPGSGWDVLGVLTWRLVLIWEGMLSTRIASMWVCVDGTWQAMGGMEMACSLCVDGIQVACEWLREDIWISCGGRWMVSGWRVEGV